MILASQVFSSLTFPVAVLVQVQMVQMVRLPVALRRQRSYSANFLETEISVFPTSGPPARAPSISLPLRAGFLMTPMSKTSAICPLPILLLWTRMTAMTSMLTSSWDGPKISLTLQVRALAVKILIRWHA